MIYTSHGTDFSTGISHLQRYPVQQGSYALQGMYLNALGRNKDAGSIEVAPSLLRANTIITL